MKATNAVLQLLFGIASIGCMIIGSWLGLHDQEWARGTFYLVLAIIGNAAVSPK